MRINNDDIKRGYAISDSVSPFDQQFVHVIEDGIREVVYRLVGKNYLTLSSCEGHTKYDTTNIVMAFNNQMQILKFIKEIDVHKLPLIKFRQFEVDEYMEPVEDFKEEHKNIPKHRREGIYNTRSKMSHNQAIKCLNQLYRRAYDDYMLLEVIIIPNSESCKSWWEEVKLGWWKFWNKKKHIEKFLDAIDQMSYYDM